MYHSAFPPSIVLNGHLQQKSPVLMTYADVSFIAVDPRTLQQIPQLYSPVILDVPNMKRIPFNLLAHSVESMNCYIPMWGQPRGFSRTLSHHRFTKDNSFDSSCASDGGASSSRSSTPSSVGNSLNSSPKANDKRTRKGSENGTSVSRDQCQISLIERQSSGFMQPTMANFKFGNHLGDEVSQQIWQHYLKNRQPEDMYIKKMRLRSTVQNILNESFTNSSLWVVGSSVNGLGANTSDMDMCLVLTTTEIDQQTEAMLLLKCVEAILRKKCSFIKSTELITAKVPILKFTDKLGIQVDLNINNTVGIANTVLIRDYCCLDWRVQPLVLVIKKWAQDCNINNAKDMTLSSYSLTLMVIHYLQCGCSPPVLPCLQKMRPDTHKNLPKIKSNNMESLGELLFGFFDYFSNKFDFDREVMSIRLGCTLSKYQAINYRSTKNKRGHWKFICIEEPFNRTNTACAVYDADSFGRILTAFRSTWIKLKVSREISAVLKL